MEASASLFSSITLTLETAALLLSEGAVSSILAGERILLSPPPTEAYLDGRELLPAHLFLSMVPLGSDGKL